MWAKEGCRECNSNHEWDMVSTVIMTVCGLDLPSDSALFYTELQDLNV